MNVLGEMDGIHHRHRINREEKVCVVSECVAAFAGWCAVCVGWWWMYLGVSFRFMFYGYGLWQWKKQHREDSSERWVITSR
jgi:hypothetical protein